MVEGGLAWHWQHSVGHSPYETFLTLKNVRLYKPNKYSKYSKIRPKTKFPLRCHKIVGISKQTKKLHWNTPESETNERRSGKMHYHLFWMEMKPKLSLSELFKYKSFQ